MFESERRDCGLLLQACGVPPSIHTHLGSTGSGMRRTHERSFSLHTTTLHKKAHQNTTLLKTNPHAPPASKTRPGCAALRHTATLEQTPHILLDFDSEVSGSSEVRSFSCLTANYASENAVKNQHLQRYSSKIVHVNLRACRGILRVHSVP